MAQKTDLLDAQQVQDFKDKAPPIGFGKLKRVVGAARPG